MSGLLGQHFGIGFERFGSGCVALHRQHAVRMAANVQGHAQPRRKAQVALGLGDMSVGLKLGQPCLVDSLGSVGVQGFPEPASRLPDV